MKRHLLVDSGLPECSDEIRAALRRLSDRSIGFIINTTIDRDHTGGNENLAKGGVDLMTSANQKRPQAAIVSHLSLLDRLTGADGAALGIGAKWFCDGYV